MRNVILGCSRGSSIPMVLVVVAGAIALVACGGSAAENKAKSNTAAGASKAKGDGNGADEGGGASSSDISSVAAGGMSSSSGSGKSTTKATTTAGGSAAAVGGSGPGVGGTGVGTSPSTAAAMGGVGAASAVEPADTRPARPAWTPPFTAAVGTSGWEQSTEPICEANQGLEGAFNVWADGRGVYAMVSAGCNVFAGAGCGKDGASIKVNTGAGWSLLYQFAPGTVDYPTLLGGFPEGPLLVGGTIDGKQGIAFVEKGSLNFQIPVSEPSGAFVASKDLAYVIDGSTLMRYSAGNWSKVGQSTSRLLAVWADPQTVIAVGEDQTILMKTGSGALAPIPGVPAGVYGSVWAFGPSDIWAGNTAGQLVHYDGSKWQTVPTGSRDISGSGIVQIWGASGSIYFITYAEMGKVNGTAVQMLLSPPADTDMSSYPGQFRSIWGRSSNEVFVALRDSTYKKYACGSVYLLWYDGSEFHQM